MAENTVGLFFEISADPSKAVQALSQFSSASEQHSTAVAGHLRALQAGAEQARQAHAAAFGQMARSVRGYGDATTRIYALVAESILKSMELNNLEATNHATAQSAKLVASKGAVKELAAIKAVESFAKGLEALGDFNFFSAAKYFGASALYGTLGALQIESLLGASGGGGSVRGPSGASSATSGGAAATGPVALAPGSASALAPAGGNVTVMVVGEPQAAAWITKVINTGVLQHDLMLVSSHTKRSAPAGR